MKAAIPLLEAAREVEGIFSELRLQAIVIGGLATFRWGTPRATQDVDFTMLCPPGKEASSIAALLQRLRGRTSDAGSFAEVNRVLLLWASNGRPVDVVLGGLPYEARAVARGSMFEYAPGIDLRTASAEDLVVMKAFAARDRDWIDVEGILARQRARLDWVLIERELKPLLEAKEDAEAWSHLEAMRNR